KSAFVHVFARPLTKLEAVSARQDEATPDLSQAHSQAEPTGQSLQVIERTSIERLATRVTARLPLRRVGREECELVTIEGEEADMYGANSIHKSRDLSPDLRRAAEARSEERRVGKECRSRWS